MSNFKQIHIGSEIKRITELNNISLERACKFHKCTPQEIEEMYNSSSLHSDVLLKWSKLLKYNVFMFYHTHLQIYSPSSATAKLQEVNQNKEDRDVETYFRKNLYSPEIIQWLLSKIELKEMSVKDVIKKYNIPKTTIYRWIKKAQKTEQLSNKEKKRKEVKLIDYRSLYTEFVNDLEFVNLENKKSIMSKIKLLSNEKLKFQTLYKINSIIKKEYHSSYNSLNTYDKSYIKKILAYQKEYGLSDNVISNEYKMSRNTIANWRKIFSEID